MIDREKMINALNDIADYFRTCRKNAASNGAAARRFEIYVEAAEEAAELLKAQEPRVLALEELQDWKDAVWFDELGEDEPFIALIDNYDITMAKISFVDTTLYRKLTSHDMRLYNRWWRCWTSKPTEEQREAVPWRE